MEKMSIIWYVNHHMMIPTLVDWSNKLDIILSLKSLLSVIKVVLNGWRIVAKSEVSFDRR